MKSRTIPALATFAATVAAFAAGAARAESILFIGNSFTYAQGSAVHYYRAGTVTDLNGEGIGGLPALFKSFADQSGLAYDVYLETHGGIGLDWHLANEAGVLGSRSWDRVVMHGYSTLDAKHPGDPALLVETSRRMAELLAAKNPAIDIRLLATWPRADQVYPAQGAWHGKTLAAMNADLRAGYDRAAAAAPQIHGVVPVGDAWMRAVDAGVADPDPYDGTAAGQVDLWTYDHYHASNFGYYLEALVVFGSVTGHDPRALGAGECSAYELGLSPAQAGALERVAYQQLVASGLLKEAPAPTDHSALRQRCAAAKP
ncbi:MAG: PEP-CTERM sorting domain-containing protein [Burkholderiales bacterium]|nr:PEP-CTERM sorting domain-containing protein [Burkholderiales bacterium]